jgi:ABC-2 type transport system permease protein
VRHALVLARYWRASLAAAMEYRVNFALSSLTSVGTLIGGVFSLTLFYNGSYAFPGWSFDDCLVVLGVFKLLTAFADALLTPNLNRIVQQVDDGSLDFVLLKPIDSQFQVSLRQLSPWGLPDLVLGGGLVVYGAAGRASLSDALFALPPMLASALLLSRLWFALASTSIWFVKIYNATEVLRGLLDAGRYPVAAFPFAFRVFFTVVVPVAFLTTVPAEAALGRAGLDRIGWSFVAAAIAFTLTRLLWRRAQRSYTSASS